MTCTFYIWLWLRSQQHTAVQHTKYIFHSSLFSVVFDTSSDLDAFSLSCMLMNKWKASKLSQLHTNTIQSRKNQKKSKQSRACIEWKCASKCVWVSKCVCVIVWVFLKLNQIHKRIYPKDWVIINSFWCSAIKFWKGKKRKNV